MRWEPDAALTTISYAMSVLRSRVRQASGTLGVLLALALCVALWLVGVVLAGMSVSLAVVLLLAGDSQTDPESWWACGAFATLALLASAARRRLAS